MKRLDLKTTNIAGMLLRMNFQRDKTLNQLFEDLAQHIPNNIAAIFENTKLTYKDLNEKSTELANYLIRLEVKPESIVSLSVNSNFHLLIGILGILKTGGVYLPLDPSYPSERLQFALENSKAAVLLTETHLNHLFSGFKNTINLDNEYSSSTHPAPFSHKIKLQNLAYIMYTSGTTGNPKGVMIEHKGFANAVLTRMKFYHNNIKTLLLNSIAFDMSIMIIFHTLLSGGTLVLPNKNSHIDAENILELVEKHSINYLLCVPSLYAMLLQKAGNFPSLKNVVLGGENVPQSLLDSHSKQVPHAYLFNEYGPTECSICTTVAKIYDPVDGKVDKISIGKPLENTQIYVLDENLQEVPVGTKGEMFIGGVGLARGYINNPELTAEKFIQVTFPDQRSVLLYRTGDFGRILSNGDIEFLGRVDHQVKIRGYRIELGEIEQAICSYPEIKEMAVIAREDSSGNKRLVAYFSSAVSISIEGLRSHMAGILPKHMVPSLFMQLDSFPLTSNGKIDRKALPDPVEIREIPSEDFLSELEKALLNIWKKTLSLEVISVQDNFFDIGGDSLLVVSIQASIEEHLHLKVPIVDLFQYPTIAQIAAHLRNNQNENETSRAELAKSQAGKRRAALQRIRKHAEKELEPHE